MTVTGRVHEVSNQITHVSGQAHNALERIGLIESERESAEKNLEHTQQKLIEALAGRDALQLQKTTPSNIQVCAET